MVGVLLGSVVILFGCALAAFGLNPAGSGWAWRILGSKWLWVGFWSAAFVYYAVDAYFAVRAGSDASARAARDLFFLPMAAAAVAGSGAFGERMKAMKAAEQEGKVSGVLLLGGVLVFGVGLGMLTGGIAIIG